MFYQEAPPCKLCGRVFVPVNNSRICHACRHHKKRSKMARNYPQRENPILCDCGQPAVVVVEVHVGEDGCYREYMPLCEACRDLEQAFFRQDAD